MRSGVRKKWDDLNFKAESFYRKYEYRKKAKLRLKRMADANARKSIMRL